MASILIIDDDVTLLARLGAQLEDAGYQVEKAGSIEHAERSYADQRPDLVILEPRTGGDAGWDLLPRLAAGSAVVVLTGAGREEDVVRGFSAGAIDYVTKPYRSEEFLARLRVRVATLPAPEPAPEPAPAAPAVPAANLAQVRPFEPPRRRNRRPDPVDETVFMSEAEEMALLRMPGATPAQAESSPETADSNPEALGARLRAERLRRHLTLVQVENELKIRMSYLQAMEDEKFTLLPRGPVAVQMVRTYAGFLGLDAGALAEEFRSQHYVDPIEPPPALGGSSLPRSVPRWVILLAAVTLALAVAAGAIYAFDPGFFQSLPAYLQSLPTYLQGLWQQLMALFDGG